MRLRQPDSSVPPPRRKMTHEGPMQDLVPRAVLLELLNNNIAVPNSFSPNVDPDKGVTLRHGFIANSLTSLAYHQLGDKGEDFVARARYARV